MRVMLRVLAVLGAFGMAGPGFAETEQVNFRTLLFGVPVGQMILASNSNGAAYAAKGHFRTTGLAGLLARVRFTMSARGVGDELNLRSRSYSEDLDTGYRTSAANVTFTSGDRRIDPLTGLLAALLDRKAASGCAFDGKTWDGKRAMQVSIRPATEADNGDLTCAGRLTRLSGYTAEEMDDWVSFPFTIRYVRDGETLSVERADIETIHGKVALLRR